MVLNIFTDGGSRNNPGKAACAYVAYDENKRKVLSQSKYLNIATNNVAEYEGVLLALEYLVKNKEITKVNFYLDSILICQQLNGRFKIKDKELQKLAIKAFQLINSLSYKPVFNIIPREQNYEADRLVNLELDLHIA